MADLEYLTERVRAAASTSIRPFSSSQEYLYAMKEDLADWLNTLFELELTVGNFVPRLETGVILCHLANMVRHKAMEYLEDHPGVRLSVPGDADISPSGNAEPGTFRARENVAIFIDWCRRRLGVSDSLMFETNDLIEGRNERSFVLCLLEVARRGAKFGMLAPMLIQMEQEIEEEIREEAPPPPQRRVCDLSSLDDMPDPVNLILMTVPCYRTLPCRLRSALVAVGSRQGRRKQSAVVRVNAPDVRPEFPLTHGTACGNCAA
ncbi:cytoskeletal adaptor [Branchiostoma belcheri]|nr:cytoskeletal adaptor [Branchiostoma belcheri]